MPSTAFFDQADPVAAFFRGVQAWLGAPQTGVWDKATHDAFGAWAGAGSRLPAWGTPQAAWTAEQAAAVERIRQAMTNLPMTLDIPASGPIPSQTVPLLAALRLPTDSYENLGTVIYPAIPRLSTLMPKVFDAALASATTPPSPPWYKRTSTYVIGGGVLLLGVILLAGRKSE